MEEMTLRVPVAVKAKVTEDLKAKIVSDLETRLDMVNKDLEAIEFQAQRILADAAKVDATSLTAIRQQIDEEKNNVDFVPVFFAFYIREEYNCTK